MKEKKPQTVADVKFDNAVAPKSVPAARVLKRKTAEDIKETRQPKFQTMFTRLDLEKEEKHDTSGKGKSDHDHQQ